ncbi:hypothetical protein SAMN02745166_04583 [Prosthecobacter debontii]|uniref:Uncharacterized protein n=1 Tax=Prosthecobacter debontii TaxID=48467 RepID=A0A1T4YYN1_9BACT|nr:hypothetical protein [Prosthecobacter debontii]SKB06899.1 hypothetical protein SAMN02745166_04583 [Prosthecobacter debontii]
MKRLTSFIFGLWLTSSAWALTPQQVEQLQDAKKQFEAGLISQTIYEEVQRKILELTPPSSIKSEAAPKVTGDPTQSAVLAKLTKGYWRLTTHLGEAEAYDGPVHRFRLENGKFSITRFKSNYNDEPGRAVEQPVKELIVKDKGVAFSYLKDPADPKSVGILEISLDEKGEFEVSGVLGPPWYYTLTPAPVMTNREWNEWHRKTDEGNALSELLGTVSEIWKINGEPDHELSGDCFLVWYNAVAVPRTYRYDFGYTLRPFILKMKTRPQGGFEIVSCFDYMQNQWMEFPTLIYETSLDETYVNGVMEGKISESEWNEFVQKTRARDKEMGNRAKSEIPLKDGGTLRGKSPHISPPDEDA